MRFLTKGVRRVRSAERSAGLTGGKSRGGNSREGVKLVSRISHFIGLDVHQEAVAVSSVGGIDTNSG